MHRFLAFTLVTLVTSAPLAAQTATATLSADLGAVAKLSFSSTTLVVCRCGSGCRGAGPGVWRPHHDYREGAGGAGPGRPRPSSPTGIRVPASTRFQPTRSPGRRPAPASSAARSARTTPQVVGSWTGSGVRVGSQTFLFRNSWTYRGRHLQHDPDLHPDARHEAPACSAAIRRLSVLAAALLTPAPAAAQRLDLSRVAADHQLSPVGSRHGADRGLRGGAADLPRPAEQQPALDAHPPGDAAI